VTSAVIRSWASVFRLDDHGHVTSRCDAVQPSLQTDNIISDRLRSRRASGAYKAESLKVQRTSVSQRHKSRQPFRFRARRASSRRQRGRLPRATLPRWKS